VAALLVATTGLPCPNVSYMSVEPAAGEPRLGGDVFGTPGAGAGAGAGRADAEAAARVWLAAAALGASRKRNMDASLCGDSGDTGVRPCEPK